MSIDWENRPEGATHYRGGIFPRWLRVQAGMVQYFVDGSNEWHDYSDQVIGNDALSCAVERPKAEWNGVGLPPVGTVCEALWSEARDEWLKTKIFGVNEHGQPIHRWEQGPKQFDYQASPLSGLSGRPYFRPIRTPEQIAAEEALRDIELLYSEGGPAAVYDAGYRKVEGGAQ